MTITVAIRCKWYRRFLTGGTPVLLFKSPMTITVAIRCKWYRRFLTGGTPVLLLADTDRLRCPFGEDDFEQYLGPIVGETVGVDML